MTGPAIGVGAVGVGYGVSDAVLYQSQTFVAPPIYNKAVVAGRVPESRVEYIPYEVREMVYDTIEKAEVIPIQRTITEYEQLRHT